MTTLANRIHGKGPFEYDEALANAALSPGHLVELMSTGKVRKHSTAGGRAERLFALEDANTGASLFRNSSGQTADTAYAADDLVPLMIPARGGVVNALLKAGVSYAIGDKLVSAGDGTLEKETSLASSGLEKDCIGVVYDKALDLSGSGAVATRNPVRII